MKVRVFLMATLIAAGMGAYHANAATPPSGTCAPIAQEGATLPSPLPTVKPYCGTIWPKMRQACTVAITHGQACTACQNLVQAYFNSGCVSPGQ
jgi:hypothetical protein